MGLFSDCLASDFIQSIHRTSLQVSNIWMFCLQHKSFIFKPTKGEIEARRFVHLSLYVFLSRAFISKSGFYAFELKYRLELTSPLSSLVLRVHTLFTPGFACGIVLQATSTTESATTSPKTRCMPSRAGSQASLSWRQFSAKSSWTGKW